MTEQELVFGVLVKEAMLRKLGATRLQKEMDVSSGDKYRRLKGVQDKIGRGKYGKPMPGAPAPGPHKRTAQTRLEKTLGGAKRAQTARKFGRGAGAAALGAGALALGKKMFGKKKQPWYKRLLRRR